MSSIFELKEVEALIESVASRFRKGTDFEELLHEGRIAVWELCLRASIAADAIEGHLPALEEELVKTYKRHRSAPLFASKGKVSLDAPLGAEGGMLLHESLPSAEPTPLDLLLVREEEVQTIEPSLALLQRLKRDSLRTKTLESKQAVVYLLVRLLGFGEKDVPKRVTYRTFVDHGLQGWLWVFFNNSPFRAINAAYPDRYLPYHMARAPMRYWTGRGAKARAVAALRRAVEETRCERAHIPRLMTEAFFREFKLTAPLWKLFGTQYAYLNAAYPGAFHPWELPITPRGFFDSETHVVRAVRWLVEERLGYPLGELTVKAVWAHKIAYKITKDAFCRHGLREIMAIYKSPEPALRLAYPDKFLPWSFQTKGKWSGAQGKRLAAEATRWFVEEYLKASPLSSILTWEMFRQNGFHGMISDKHLGFGGSPARALLNAYPELAGSFRCSKGAP
jgi:hypothetical protein